jgi:hypothetical protein
MEKIKLILLLTLLCSCNTSEKKITKVERISLEAEIITDSIHASLPGRLIVFNDYVVWEEAFASDKFLHVVDIQTRKEVGRMGEVGQGPKEFIHPQISRSYDDCILAFVQGTKHQAYFSIERFLAGEDYYIPVPNSIKINPKSNFRLLEIEKGQFITLQPNSDKLLEHWNRPYFYSFGKFPIPESLRKDDRFNYFQGDIAYNPDLKKLIYTSYRFPYMAIYTKSGKSFKLQTEVKGKFDYSVSSGGEFKRSRDSKRGPRELTLTLDYIVTVDRDLSIDQTDENEVGRDPMKLPHTVFIYDYEGNLLKIANLGFPVVRIAADTKNNTLYAIVVMDDYVLVKYEL